MQLSHVWRQRSLGHARRTAAQSASATASVPTPRRPSCRRRVSRASSLQRVAEARCVMRRRNDLGERQRDVGATQVHSQPSRAPRRCLRHHSQRQLTV